MPRIKKETHSAVQERNRKRAAKLSNPAVQELPSGAWRCRVYVGNRCVSFVDDDPVVAHAQAVAHRAGLTPTSPEEGGKRTLSQAIDDYIDERRNVLSPSSVLTYKGIKRVRLQSLMSMKVADIDESAIQAAINDEATTVSAKTIKAATSLVIAVLSKHHPINTHRLRYPQRKNQEHTYLDADGIVSLIDAIQGSDVEVPLLLAVWLGMRRSEILGLCWDKVDFERKRIHIHRTYIKGTEGYVLREGTKTEGSRRTLDCPDYILTRLAALSGKREGRIFTIHPNNIYKKMKVICEANEIPFVGVHGLRHTNASVMLSLGIIDKVAMARGGWSTDVTMRQVYQHAFASDKDAAGEKIDDFFKALTPQKADTK